MVDQVLVVDQVAARARLRQYYLLDLMSLISFRVLFCVVSREGLC